MGAGGCLGGVRIKELDVYLRDVMTDLELLAKAGLEPPPMVRLFSNLGLGVNAGNIPMDMGDAVSFLKKRIA